MVSLLEHISESCGAVHFGGVQIHGGKENLIEGNLFIDCLAGLSFSRWDEKRWLESIKRFLPQAGKPPYVSRYPELADLQANANVNLICRNVFVRCDSTFLRDGRVQKTTLNVVTDQPSEEAQVAPGQRSLGNVALLRPLLFEPIPIDEMGPYESK
jgi:hypothetical protein